MSTTKLQIYQGALLLLGELRLNSTAGLTESREARHLLDLVWNRGGVDYCLEQAQWHFAMRASRLDFNPAIAPDWGYKRVFDKPTDWILTSGVFLDEYLRTPLTDYADEIGFFFTDYDEIYVKYVSNDTTYGGDLSRWPESFTRFVEAYFAGEIVHKMPGSAELSVRLLGPPGREDKGILAHRLLVAKNKAAMTQPVTFPQRGTWQAARHNGRRRRYWDGGNIGRLIG